MGEFINDEVVFAASAGGLVASQLGHVLVSQHYLFTDLGINLRRKYHECILVHILYTYAVYSVLF